jgi:hypothetical protein
MNIKLLVEKKEHKPEIYDFKRQVDKTEIVDAMYIKFKNKKFLLEQFFSDPSTASRHGMRLSSEPLFIGIKVYREHEGKWVPVIMTRHGEEYIQGASFYEGYAHKLFRNVPKEFYKVLALALMNSKDRKMLLYKVKPSTKKHFEDIIN